MLEAELQSQVFWAYSLTQVQWGPNLSRYRFPLLELRIVSYYLSVPEDFNVLCV